ncbi:MAG: hypothetical protein R6U15_04860 [Candidatus Izemoplasmatales bacterium]
MKSINDDLFQAFEGQEIDNLEAISIKGGTEAEPTRRWTLEDGAGNYIDCASDSAVNEERVAGYDCDCIDTNTGTRSPC